MEAEEVTRRESIMVLLHEILDVNLLRDHIKNGYVTERNHDTLPLSIFNYTPKAQYEWKWDEVTMKCRGLIVSHTGEVVARPFEKFFNWDQGIGRETWQNPMPPAGPVLRMEKMDGSLGILYQTSRSISNGVTTTYGIATRGSFHSEQAEWATAFLADSKEFSNLDFSPYENKTYLFEIVYPENRIVVDYGEYRGLVLIDVIDTETGKSDLQEFDECGWPDKVKRMHLNLGFDSGQAADIPPGDEGFVYLWPEKNYRVKMKSAEYMELHRLVSRLSEKTIWEMLMEGRTRDQIKAGLPDEFYGFVDKTCDAIQYSALDIVQNAVLDYDSIIWRLGENPSRKEFAALAKDSDYRKYLFLMLDGKDIYGLALADSKPKTNKALVSAEDI